MSIDYFRQNHATDNFAKGHIEYLERETRQLEKELQQASMADPKLEMFRKQLDSLISELDAVCIGINNPTALVRGKEQIENIRKALHDLASSL